MSKKILIVRPDGIGDFLIFSALLEAYEQLYPEYTIDLLCHPKVKDLGVAIPFIKNVYVLNVFRLNRKKYAFYLVYLLIRLNLNRYEKIIYPVYSSLKEVDEVIKLISAKEKIAFDGDKANDPTSGRSIRNRIYQVLIEGDRYIKPEMDRNLEFIRKLGSTFQAELRTKFWFLPQDEEYVQKFMQGEGLSEKKYICLFPGAGYEIKYWSSQNWIALINRLLNAYRDYKIVLLGSGSDLKPISEILSGIQKNAMIVNLCDKTNLRELAKVIEHSFLFIGMDTGAIHIAAAVNVPNICIMGGGHFGRFYPYGDLNNNRIVHHQMDCYGCNWQCIYDEAKCIKDIKVEDVLQEIENVI